MVDIKSVLETMDKVMSTVKVAADMPGINLIPYVSTISGIIGTVHSVYSAGKVIEPYLEEIQATFPGGGKVPTQIEVDALNVKIKSLEAQLQAPMPAKEDGEPD